MIEQVDVHVVRIHVKNNQTHIDFYMYLDTDDEVRDFLNSLNKRIYTVLDVQNLTQQEMNFQ